MIPALVEKFEKRRKHDNRAYTNYMRFMTADETGGFGDNNYFKFSFSPVDEKFGNRFTNQKKSSHSSSSSDDGFSALLSEAQAK